MSVDLSVDVGDVAFDRPDADEQIVAYLAVALSGGYEPQHLQLALG